MAHRTRVHPSPAHHHPSPPKRRLWLRLRRTPSERQLRTSNRTYAWGYHSGPCHYFTSLYLLVSVSGSVSALNGVRFAKFGPIRSLTVCYLTDPTAHWLHLHQSPVSSMITSMCLQLLTSLAGAGLVGWLAGWLAGWRVGMAWGTPPHRRLQQPMLVISHEQGKSV